MARALKVFCTPIGFHDAYVAAPSQKAALEAWGSDANLFARGMATIVTDPGLTKAPLAAPGQIIKRARSTAAEHLAAMPKLPTQKAMRSKAAPSDTQKKAKPTKPTARPSRRKLDAAERAVELADTNYRTSIEAIHKREEALRRERQRLHTKRDTDMAKLQRRLDEVKVDYDAAMDDWRA